MPYTEVSFLISPVDPWREILMVELADLGYDSFEDGMTDPVGPSGELKAYIPSDRFDANKLSGLLTLRDPHVSVHWTSMEIADRNWNAEWEGSFQPVEVGREVRIRAEFHPMIPGFAHDLVITPRMAFGTGHHATTRMMIQAMLGLDLVGRNVCDLGCGTGVLAILAERLGAEQVMAIDNDPGAVDNAKSNIERNGCHAIAVEKGDADSLRGRSYAAILANIERNVLMDAMPVLAEALEAGGTVLLSGFVVNDRHLLAQRAREHGLEPSIRLQEGEWALLGCRRPDR